ncbi:MAG: HdaA/DnaA family protein [Rhodospirillales bacterium]
MSRTPQLVLALDLRPSLAAEDFIVTPANQAAVSWIERYPRWPAPLLALSGPAGSGKSHLAQVWRARTHAAALDPGALDPATLPRALGDAPAVLLDFAAADLSLGPAFDERALLHLYNLLAERGGHALVLAREPPSRWRLTLADLRSRLLAAPTAAIGPPDDALLAAVLGKLFADRQLRAEPGVIDYLARNMERSLEAAGRVVAEVDREALAQRRGLSVALARAVLENLS